MLGWEPAGRHGLLLTMPSRLKKPVDPKVLLVLGLTMPAPGFGFCCGGGSSLMGTAKETFTLKPWTWKPSTVVPFGLAEALPAAVTTKSSKSDGYGPMRMLPLSKGMSRPVDDIVG